MITASTLLETTHALLERQLDLPFVRGLGDGTLSRERFQRWLLQDWFYLQTYARSVAAAAARAPELATLTRWADLLHLTLHQEMDGHRLFAARFGLKDLDSALILPTNRVYTDFLLQSAKGSYAEIVATHLPCAWDYHAVACHLKARARVSGTYGEWIRQYADPAFGEAALWLRDELDRALSLPGADPERVQEVFTLARTFEVLFWEMCWSGDLALIGPRPALEERIGA